MTDIDPSADIESTGANEHVTARIPLAGQVTGERLGCYHRLARAAAVPVRAETQPDRAWIVVTSPYTTNQSFPSPSNTFLLPPPKLSPLCISLFPPYIFLRW